MKPLQKKLNFSPINIVKNHWLFFVILTLGIIARTWDFGNTPPGLNPDEASIGVEAYYLYKFGMDRNGISYPVHLISWGSGQNALYAYLLIPFIALKGLNTEAIRLPMMLSGILALPLMHRVGSQLFGKKYGLIAMFFLAISPWHIVNTRWAVESNILPFIFLAGFAFLLETKQNQNWFFPAIICFSLSLYAYGTTYIAVPIFLLIGIPVIIRYGKLGTKRLILGLGLFLLTSLPILLFIIINLFKLESLHLGSITIPRLPVEARYESLAAVYENNPFRAAADNLTIMLKLLWNQQDAFVWNYVDPFGYFYRITFPLAVIGFFYLVWSFRKLNEDSFGYLLLFAWLVASLAIGVVHPVNLTRLNLIFIPLLLCTVLCVMEINKRIGYFTPTITVSLFIAFIFFNLQYHGESYQKRASEAFNSGILPALEFASQSTPAMICVTEQTRFGYIYTFFINSPHPFDYINQIEWVLPPEHPLDPSRTPRSLGVFHFKLSDCANTPDAIYVLKLKETPPNPAIHYKMKRFDKYQVFLPKPP
ncbi:hypothetical protein MASR2M66_29040 [Chloroflexota bacterium]